MNGLGELENPPQLDGEGDGTPLQYFCLENPMDGRAWWAAVHRVTKSWIQLSDFTLTFILLDFGKDRFCLISIKLYYSSYIS